MYPFLETIKIQNGKVQKIKWHQMRIDATLFEVYGLKSHKIDLKTISEKISSAQNFPKSNLGIFRFRLLYDFNDFEYQIFPYEIRNISQLKLVEVNSDFDYHLKYSDRKKLNDLVLENQEVLIIKNNLITDTTYTNVALLRYNQWFTPEKPLLNGTMRQYLIAQKIIFPLEIKKVDIQNFSHIMLFNAMMNWDEAIVLETKFIV